MSRAECMKERFAPFFVWIQRRVPPGFRFALGLLLICGGILGFLPILGFWMLPLGLMVAAMDVRLFRRWRSLRRRRRAERP
ncbi:hypothetical protein ACGYLI_11310 [Sulfitobacter sp. 1A13421]|uniref:hypothetical protein n=2 Tax=Sulfitobacter TaxID=60136 RepID=UPI0037462F6E